MICSIYDVSIISVFVLLNNFFVFFFKQKTAYEMRISDWSSDVCSSDLFLRCLQYLLGALLRQILKHSEHAIIGLVRRNGRGFGPCTIGVFVQIVTRSNGTVHAAFIKTERSDLPRQPFCFRRLRCGTYLLHRLPGACVKEGGRQDTRHNLFSIGRESWW